MQCHASHNYFYCAVTISRSLGKLMRSVPDIPFQCACANRGCARCTGLDHESQLVLINQRAASGVALLLREKAVVEEDDRSMSHARSIC